MAIGRGSDGFGPHVTDGSRAERTFGLHPTPAREAVQAMVAWYRARYGAAIA